MSLFNVLHSVCLHYLSAKCETLAIIMGTTHARRLWLW